MECRLVSDKTELVISTKGAEMQSISKEGTEYLWNGDAKYWAERSPLLFPFVGRLTEGTYYLRGQEYGMDIHGFARNLEFEIVKQSDTKVVLCAGDSEDTYRVYPFRFGLTVQYELCDSAITVTYRVHNRNNETMYFGIGGHPGFRVPLEDGLRFEDYYLEFASAHCPERVGHTEACFLSGANTAFPLEDGRRCRLHHSMFDEDAIVLQNVADRVILKSDKGTKSVTLSYPELPYLGLWHTPKTEAPYICIEPWTSLPSRQDVVEEFAYKSDLIRLRAGQAYENRWEIIVE